MKLLVFLISALALALSKPAEESFLAGQIVGGNDPDVPHLVPWQVWLKLRNKEKTVVCGGSLISNKYILTAGHCAQGRTSGSVLLGAYDRTKPEPDQKLVQIKRFIPHPKFDRSKTKGYDIGLIEMEESVEESEGIKIGTLPTYADVNKTYVGETGRASGWGKTSSGQYAEILQYFDEKIISFHRCERFFKDVLESDVCLSGKHGQETCSGDSGGPLTVEEVIIGVLSFGAPNCGDGSPSVFTRTTVYLDWIQENSDVTIEQ